MSFQRVSASMEIGMSDGLAKWVLVSLAHRENSKSGHCFPSIEMLVKDTGLSRSTVLRCLKKLVDLKLIRKHPDRGRSTHYEFLFKYKVVRFEKNQCHTDTTPVSERHPNKEVIKNKDVVSGVKDVFKSWFPSKEQQQLLNNEFGEINHDKEIRKYKERFADSSIAVPFAHYRAWCARIQDFESADRGGKKISRSKTNNSKAFGNRKTSSLTDSIRSVLSN
tara:strand:+ start:114 stop:776 length:663 start_codon:yes stop_codon:yes gene_type:complete